MLFSQESEAVIDARVGVCPETDTPGAAARVTVGGLAISVHEDLAAVAALWQAFEVEADCTVFQAYAWHAAWQANIGARSSVTAAIVVGRERGRVLFVLPLAVESGLLVRRLVWHASDLCDYNGPLLANDFGDHVPAGGFAALWAAILRLLRDQPHLRPDVVVLERMPESIGHQSNPFVDLPLSSNPSSAYLMAIRGDWETFYRDKRSSATRRHDRSKRKRLGDFGPVGFITATDRCAVEATLDTLFAQKQASFAARGVRNFLARPGVRDFYRAVAADCALHDIAHVSRLEVGAATVATNLGLVFRGRYYHVLASYAGGAVARFGPGTTHLHDLIGYALARGCTEFDFTVGDETYKRDWCDSELHLRDYRAAASPRGWLVAHGSVALTSMKRAVKRRPSLWRAVARARAFGARLKGHRSRVAVDSRPHNTVGGA